MNTLVFTRIFEEVHSILTREMIALQCTENLLPKYACVATAMALGTLDAMVK